MINICLNQVNINLAVGLKKLAPVFFGYINTLNLINFETFVLLILTISILSSSPPPYPTLLIALSYLVEDIQKVLLSMGAVNSVVKSLLVVPGSFEKSLLVIINIELRGAIIQLKPLMNRQ